MRRFSILSIIILLASASTLFSGDIQYEILYRTRAPVGVTEKEITDIVDDALQWEQNGNPYLRARIKVFADKDALDYLVVYMLRADIYLAEIYKIETRRNNTFHVSNDYTEEPEREQSEVCPTCPDETIQIVVSTSESSSSHPANEGVKACFEDLDNAGIKVKALYGNEESLTAIKDWLSCKNLKLWGRIGHGASNGTIMLGSGSLRPSDVSQMDLHHKFMIINSCYVHNQNMIPEMIDDADAYFFCSGDNVSLPMYSSEPVWHNIIKKGALQDIEFGKAVTDAGNEGNMTKYGYTRNPDANGQCFWKDVCSPNITVSSPNGGEKLEQGSTFEIRWGDNIDGNVTIELFKGGSLKETLAGSTESDGSYEWQVAGDYELGDDYALKITSIDSSTLFDESDGNFSVIQEYIIVCPYSQDFDTLQAKSDVLPFKWEQATDDDLNWTVYNGPTPSRIDDPPDVTGPAADHTTGNDQGNYIYTEASASNNGNPNKKFDFTTPKLNFKSLKNPLLSFWYHMLSDNAGEDHMGELHLDICVDGTWKNDVITAISGNQGDAWKEHTLDLNQYKGDRVILRFRGITGDSWESDISLDDIEIFEDPTDIQSGTTVPASYGLQFYNSRIHFMIPAEKSRVSIGLFTMQGKMVKELVNGSVSPGTYSLPIAELAAGLYLCKMETKGFTKTIPVLVK